MILLPLFNIPIFSSLIEDSRGSISGNEFATIGHWFSHFARAEPTIGFAPESVICQEV